MDIIITESQLLLIKENVDILHYLKNFFSKKDPLKIEKNEWEPQDLYDFSKKIFEMILKIVKKTNDYKNLTITKYISEFGITNQIFYDEWTILVHVIFKPIFNVKGSEITKTEFQKLNDLFEWVMKSMGLYKLEFKRVKDKVIPGSYNYDMAYGGEDIHLSRIIFTPHNYK
jgi:hypothetical protein